MLSDRTIEDLCLRAPLPMISPFLGRRHVPGAVSAGLSSYGYDIRLAPRLLVSTPLMADRAAANEREEWIDPKDPARTARCFEEQLPLPHRGGLAFTLPPGAFALGESLETIDVPREVLVVCLGKSTYARCGLIVNVTPLEPEWRGTITLELSNTTPFPVLVYANEGIAQLVFHTGTRNCEVSYADKKGKYQDQSGIQLAKVR